ncbi:hypothetical protein BGZ67_008068 [Mortierella alpina]|nr:hypothetical protein BGZ67_008068 [Mortierella alpina]
MAAEVFVASELVVMVAQHLSLRDIAACRLTSKALNKAFNPYLWRHISTTKTTDKSLLARTFHRARASGSLHRNRQYIETLSLEIFAAEYMCALLNIATADGNASTPSAPAQAQAPAGTPGPPGFSSLKSLTITIGALNDIYSHWDAKDKTIASEPLIGLLGTAPNLTSLTLYPEVLGSSKFVATLDVNLPHLETFILRRAIGPPAMYFPVSCVLPILQPLFSKPKLKTLLLNFVMAYKRTLHSALVAKKMKELAKTQAMISSAMVKLIQTMIALRTFVVVSSTLNVKGHILKTQKLDLDPEINPGLPSGELGDEDLGYVAMRKFFKNLGELTELEDLYIKHVGYSEWILDKIWTLGVGLGFLGGLVKLRKLRLDYGLEHIGRAEVEFMHKHWPNLKEVVCSGEQNHVDKYKHPWTWLKARRPYLKYTYDTFVRCKEEYNPFDQFLYCNLEGF